MSKGIHKHRNEAAKLRAENGRLIAENKRLAQDLRITEHSANERFKDLDKEFGVVLAKVNAFANAGYVHGIICRVCQSASKTEGRLHAPDCWYGEVSRACR